MRLFPMLRNNGLSMETRIHIYLMMIRPMLTYASPAWQHAAPSHHILFQRVQNRAARIITGHTRDTRVLQLHEDLEIPFLQDVLTYQHSFWTRMQHSQHQILQDLGTSKHSIVRTESTQVVFF